MSDVVSDLTAYRDELLVRLSVFTGEGRARRMLRRAARLAGVLDITALSEDDLLRICAALSAEGGVVQQIAEEVARASLRPEPFR